VAKELALDRVVEIIRVAFKPLRCGVEVFDYEQRIRFRVFGSDDKPLLTMSDMKVSLAQDPTDLEDTIRHARERIAKKGVQLANWSFPGK